MTKIRIALACCALAACKPAVAPTTPPATTAVSESEPRARGPVGILGAAHLGGTTSWIARRLQSRGVLHLDARVQDPRELSMLVAIAPASLAGAEQAFIERSLDAGVPCLIVLRDHDDRFFERGRDRAIELLGRHGIAWSPNTVTRAGDLEWFSGKSDLVVGVPPDPPPPVVDSMAQVLLREPAEIAPHADANWRFVPVLVSATAVQRAPMRAWDDGEPVPEDEDDWIEEEEVPLDDIVQPEGNPSMPGYFRYVSPPPAETRPAILAACVYPTEAPAAHASLCVVGSLSTFTPTFLIQARKYARENVTFGNADFFERLVAELDH
ncbi:MAG: hypothetical protein AAF721_30830 [Myxococcota bacterium]